MKGVLAVMVSGPKADFDLLAPAFEAIGRTFYISDKPGSAQTMKLVNNMLAATGLLATSEAVVMGVAAVAIFYEPPRTQATAAPTKADAPLANAREITEHVAALKKKPAEQPPPELAKSSKLQELEEELDIQIEVEEIGQEDLQSLGTLADYVSTHAITED